MERIAQAGASEGSEACVQCGAPGSQARCDECGAARTAGDFRTVRVLAKSVHGRMYEAVDGNGRRVALKELAFALVPTVQHLEAFEREARLLSQLSHPRIPKFVTSFTQGSGASTRFYLAQEFIHGESLAAAVARGPLPEAEALVVAKSVLEVLAHLHGLTPTVLHRDIKPANLIRSPTGEIFVVDFGVAREIQKDHTHNATLVGTYGYMPPEQLGGTVDARSDLFAVGATVAHLVSGKAPDQLHGEELAIDLNRVPLSDAGRRLVGRLLAVKPKDRFPSAAEALHALAKPGSGVSRRTRLLIAAALGLALAGAGIALLGGGPPPPPPPWPTPHPVAEDADAYHHPITTEPKQR